jgi:hypothetical protein
MPQINISVTPEGLSRLDLDCPFKEIPVAEQFFDALEVHIRALEAAAKEWGKEDAGHEEQN